MRTGEISGWVQLWLRVLCVSREAAKARGSSGGVTGRAAAVNPVPAPGLGRYTQVGQKILLAGMFYSTCVMV